MGTNCVRCNKDLKAFSGYIPGVGEVCKECYDSYMIEAEIIHNAKLASLRSRDMKRDTI